MKTATSPSNLHSRCGGRLAGFVALAFAVLLGTAVVPAQTASPASHPSTPAASARPQAEAVPARHGEQEESEAKPNDASHQGIKIHGHWKIDIKNPDGSLASTHEFENSLADHGSLFTYLLTGRATSGEAAVNLITFINGYSPTTYIISETSTGYWATGTNCANTSSYVCTSNLNVSAAYQSNPHGVPTNVQVVLTGSVVATSSATITEVQSAFAACNSQTGLATITPAQCHTGTVPAGTSVNSLPQGSAFFQGVLTDMQPLNIAVLSGQTIQVTVTLSFS